MRPSLSSHQTPAPAGSGKKNRCRGDRRQQRPPDQICKVDAETGEEVEQADIIKGYKENTPRELN